MNKRIVFINRTNKGSSGMIASALFFAGEKYGFDTSFIAADGDLQNNFYKIDTDSFSRNVNKLTTKISGMDGFHNHKNTRKIIKVLEEIKPDIVNIHNNLGYFLNYPTLLSYLKSKNIKVVFTCHDCWVFTGKCPHFEFVNCYKWKNECGKCPQLRSYPKSFVFDKTGKMLKLKTELFANSNITFVSPSAWLANYAKESYLSNEDIRVVNNGIDLSVFTGVKLPKENGKIALFFAANPWSDKKGLESLKFLIEKLDSNKYEFIIAGLNKLNGFDGDNINYCGVVNNAKMKDLFAKVDLFINPTLEDNFPTVDIESLACGTPIISYDTGGSPEIIGNCGVLVEKNNKQALLDAIVNYDFSITSSDCVDQASKFSKEAMVDNYYKIFKEAA